MVIVMMVIVILYAFPGMVTWYGYTKYLAGDVGTLPIL